MWCGRDSDDGEEGPWRFIEFFTAANGNDKPTQPFTSRYEQADVLRLLMESNGLSQMALARKVGISQSTISAVLDGTRSLTKEHVITLARCFNVGPGAFLPGGRERREVRDS